MKNSIVFFITSILYVSSVAQTPHPVIKQLLDETQTDTIAKYLNEFTGEIPCVVNGAVTTIKNRVSNKGNDIAADYLKEHLEKLGLTVLDQKYSSKGRNIIAEQKGTTYPDQKYIISVHYDSMADYCADDDASSCAAILETARLLTKYAFKYTIVYAFWDEEELGLLGSAYYAKQAKSANDNIKGVLQLEMLGYDSDKDFVMEVHTKSTSLALSNKLTEVNKAYQFSLVPSITNPGTTQSDHGSFWKQGYSAICFGEAFFKGDPNPAYHKATDRVGLFNLPYYYQLCHLSMALIATLAEPDEKVGIQLVDDNRLIKLNTYPNPSSGGVIIEYDLPAKTEIKIGLCNIFSQSNKTIYQGSQNAGSHQYSLTADLLPAGTYVVTLQSKTNNVSKRIIIIK